MTEADWLTSDDPQTMLAWLTTGQDYATGLPARPPSARPLRLFACACCRLVWDGAPCGRCQGTGQGEELYGGYSRGSGDPPPCPDCRGAGRVGGLTDPRSRRAVEVAERYADGQATARELGQACGLSQEVGNREWPATAACLDRAADAARWAVEGHGNQSEYPSPAAQAHLLREIFGNPWRTVRLEVATVYGLDGKPRIDFYLWRTPAALDLARAAYEERGRTCWSCQGYGTNLGSGPDRGNPSCDTCHGTGILGDGTLDPARLAVLADALEEAGCPDGDLLRHLRGQEWRREWVEGDPGLQPHGQEGWRPLRTGHVRGCWALDLILGKE